MLRGSPWNGVRGRALLEAQGPRPGQGAEVSRARRDLGLWRSGAPRRAHSSRRRCSDPRHPAARREPRRRRPLRERPLVRRLGSEGGRCPVPHLGAQEGREEQVAAVPRCPAGPAGAAAVGERPLRPEGHDPPPRRHVVQAKAAGEVQGGPLSALG